MEAIRPPFYVPNMPSGGVWYGTEAQYNALPSTVKIAYPLWTQGCGKYFEFHVLPETLTVV